MPGIVPFIPLIAAGAGMIAGNVQNKSNQQAATNAQNSAFSQNQAATAQAQASQKQALQDALSRFSAYSQQNPNPVNSLGRIQGPQQFGIGQTIGGGSVGSQGYMQQSQTGASSQGGMNPQLLQQLMAMFQQHASGQTQIQPTQRSTNVPPDPMQGPPDIPDTVLPATRPRMLPPRIAIGQGEL